jgi:NAD(P)-dependent dehydrogenase (short-subunit alcohol dehydrogenase family)
MWTIPDLHGRVALVTGANSGIGRETARVLAEHGATVVLGCRDVSAAARTGGNVLRLDLASLASIRVAAAEFHERYDRLDLLINNAGLMIPPYGLTADGFELQFGVNHLGHFALTGLLLDLITRTPESRIVTVSSNGHRRASIDFDDLQSERGYDAMTAYTRSKLANLLFTYELQRRLGQSGARAVAAHPGAARTGLMRHSPLVFRFVVSRRTKWAFSWLIQDERDGALPTLRAATDPAVRGGEYYGPDGWKEFTGQPVRVRSSAASHDPATQARLWAVSERLTGVTYNLDRSRS